MKVPCVAPSKKRWAVLLFIWQVALLVLAWSPSGSAQQIVAFTCPAQAPAAGASANAGGLNCAYAPASGYHPTHDGGPWLNVDLMAAPSLPLLQSLHDGTSGLRVYPDGPLLPALNIVHAQICLSDPTVIYDRCPNNYPQNVNGSYELNPEAITRLQKGLSLVRQAKLKVVLRFTYNFPCSGKSDPHSPCNDGNDAPYPVIARHMQLLAPTVQANADVILALQAGFIGRWGEWHNSTNGNDTPAVHNPFLDQFTALFKDYTNLEVRYPYALLDYARYKHGSVALPDVLKLGIGMHDDFFGSNVDDGGTFLPGPMRPPPPYSPCQLKQAMAALARAYTMTGETSQLYDFTPPGDCAGIANPATYEAFAAAYSLTTLQIGFAKDAWQAWVETGRYDTIVASIGPHLSLVSASIGGGPAPNAQSLELLFRNSGWAAISRPRPLWLLLMQEGRVVEKRSVAFDLRTVPPKSTLGVRIPLSSWQAQPPGAYQVFLWAPDASDRLRDDSSYALLLENPGVGDTATGFNRIGALVIGTP